jgi:RNA recognition motif-containing protein
MKTGHPKGAAFIEFTDKEGVSAALNMNGKPVKGMYKNLNFNSFK